MAIDVDRSAKRREPCRSLALLDSVSRCPALARGHSVLAAKRTGYLQTVDFGAPFRDPGALGGVLEPRGAYTVESDSGQLLRRPVHTPGDQILAIEVAAEEGGIVGPVMS